MQLSVHLQPGLVPSHELAGHLVVVVDVLRATTTILAALDSGAASVIPCASIGEATSWADAMSPRPLLGGERHGVAIPGFDLGNSPAEYVPAMVHGRDIIMTTTNGTLALTHCRPARRVLLAAFTNRSAALDAVQDERRIHIVCAGTDQAVTAEDAWLAGALVEGIAANHPIELNDSARICQAAWRHELGRRPGEDQLYQRLLESQGGRNLAALGLHEDVRFAASLDRTRCVPQYDLQRNRITAS